MPRITFHGHRPAVLRPADAPARPPDAAPDGSAEGVQKINLGFVKLKVHRLGTAERALRAQMAAVQRKSEPRASSHGFEGVRLNGAVHVTPGPNSPSGVPEAVVCRHLATAFAQYAEKKSLLMNQFSTGEGIREVFEVQLNEVQNSHKAIIRQAPQSCKHMVSSENFGNYLMALAKELEPDGQPRPKEANCLLLTSVHAMALHMQHKRKAGVSYFAVKVYDPNNTASYKRVEKLKPEDLSSLKLQQLMISPELITHYGEAENAPLSMMAVSLNDHVQPKMNRGATEPSPESMRLTLDCGAHAEFEAMLASANKEPKALFDLLQAKSSASGVPAFHSTLRDDHDKTVKPFAKAVLNSDLDETQKVELLAPKNVNGAPGLFVALQRGHSETVRAFVQAILDSNLGEEAKTALLAAKNSKGVPGLYIALKEGHTETVKAFTETVLRSNLVEPQKIELLEAKTTGNPVSGLALTVASKKLRPTLNEFRDVVRSSQLSAEAKNRLFSD